MEATKDKHRTFEMTRSFVGVNGEELRLAKPQQHVLEVLLIVEANMDARGVAFVRQVDLSASMGVSRKIVIQAIENAESAGLLVTVITRHQMGHAGGCKAYRLTPEGVRLLAERRSQLAETRQGRRSRKTGLEKFPTDAELGIGVSDDWF